MVHHSVLEIAGLTFHMDVIYTHWISAIILFIMIKLAARNVKMIPSTWQNAMESMIEFVLVQVDRGIGPKGKLVAPYIVTIFLYLVIGNNLGIVIPGLTSPTNDINATLGMAIMVLMSVHVIGVAHNGPKYLKHFIQPNPIFLPMNLLEDVSRSATLAFRLFGNILAGEILLHVLYNLSPFMVPIIWVFFSIFVGCLQATIFTILSTSYLSNAFKHGH